MSSRTKIIFDINLFPPEYKVGTVDEMIKRYEDKFNVIIVPMDSSKMNIHNAGIYNPIVIGEQQDE